MKLVRYESGQEAAWNTFAAAARNGLFLFDRRFMEYHAHRFTDHSLIFLDDADKIIGLMPANIENNILWSHQYLTFGGIITGTNVKMPAILNMFTLLRAHMRQNSITKLYYKAVPHIYHRYPAEEDLYALFCNNASLIKVEATTSVLLEAPAPYSKGKKYGIKKACRCGLHVKESLDYKTYITLLTEVLKTRHNAVPVHTADELLLLRSRFPDNIRLFTAMLNGKMLAGAVVFLYGTTAHTQYLMNTDEGKQCGALDLVIDHLLQFFGNAGYRYLDFGRSSANNAKELNLGLISQKENFGARSIVQQTFELDAG